MPTTCQHTASGSARALFHFRQHTRQHQNGSASLSVERALADAQPPRDVWVLFAFDVSLVENVVKSRLGTRLAGLQSLQLLDGVLQQSAHSHAAVDMRL